MWVVKTVLIASVTLTPAIAARCFCFIGDLPRIYSALQGTGPLSEDEYTRARTSALSIQPNHDSSDRNRNLNFSFVRSLMVERLISRTGEDRPRERTLGTW